MTTWTYTKKLICEHANAENRQIWKDRSNSVVYEDWYFDQVDANLADPNLLFLPESWSSNDLVCEILCADQAQADSLIKLHHDIKIGVEHLPAITISVVDNTA